MMNDPLQIPRGMGLHLVLGPPNAGKLGFVLRWWIENRSARPVVVVPTRADVADVELELLARVPVVFDDAPVCAVDRLVADLRPPGPPIMGNLQRSLLLGDVLASGLGGGTLAGLAGHPGGPAALTALLDELGEGGLSEDHVRAAFERRRAAGSESPAAALGSAYEAYLAGLESWGMVDRHQALAAAVDGCDEWRRPVAFHGFMSFTPAQRRLVVALSRRVPVVVTLAADRRRAQWGGPGEESSLLRPLAVSVTELPRQELAYSSPSVAYLEENFLAERDTDPRSARGGEERVTEDAVSSGPERSGGRGSDSGQPPCLPDAPVAGGPALEGVRFLVSAGRRNEVELVAAEVVSLLRAGVRPDDIGVLVRRVEPWRGLMMEVFGRYGVPYRLDGTVPFGVTGLGFALLSALRGLGSGDRDALLGYLRGPYHPAALAAVDAVEVAVREGRDRASVDAVTALMPGSLEAVRGALKWSGEVAAGVDVDGILTLAAGMLNVSARAVTPGSSRFEQDARALDALSRALGEIGVMDAEGATRARPGGGLAHRPLERALAVLAELPVSLGRGDEGGVVRVTSVNRARARRFPVVFVLGLVDGEFPGPERPPGLLPASERAALVGEGGTPILVSGGRSDDAALFALALSRPWQLLYLSCREAEEDGVETQPSPYWLEARRLVPGVPLGPRRGMEDLVYAPAVAPTEREFLRACAAFDLLPSDPTLSAHLQRFVEWECRPSRLTHPAVLGPLSVREVFSATELEKYVRCPFGWFAERAVGLRTMEEEFGPLQAGGLLHQVLRSVYEGLRRAGGSRLTPETLPGALASADDALATAIAAMKGQWPDSELALTQAEVGDRIRAFVTFDAHSKSSLTVADVESNLPAEGVDFGGFRLSGRIDRTDRDPVTGALVVIDYKSGSDLRGAGFAKHGLLQVPLYAAALRLDPEHPGTDVAGGVYVGLKTGGRRGMVLADVAERAGDWVSSGDRVAEEALEAELAEAVAAARRAADGIRRGDIRAEPLEECPSYCSLSPLCRTPRKARTW